MLGGMFPNLFGGDPTSGETALSSGAAPESLGGNERSDMASYAVLPTKPTQEVVNKAANLAGQLEADTVLLKEASTQYLAVQNAALNNLEVRVNHANSAMNNERQFQKKMARHGKNIYEHRVGVEATKQNMTGYESRFNAAKSSVVL